MATTYKASFEFMCWKRHMCVSCNEEFEYVLSRKVEGEGGTEEAAFGAAQNAAVNSMENDVDVHACPKCGYVQPDMIASVQTPWYWAAMLLGIAGVMIAFFPGLAHGFTIETSAMWAVVSMALAVAVGLMGATRNPNADQQGNQVASQRKVDDGVLRVAKGEASLESPDLEGELPPSFSGMHMTALAMMAAGLLAVLAPMAMRMVSGWPLNDRFYPAVVSPGDTTTYYFPSKLKSIKGYWRGAAMAQLENAGELGVANPRFNGKTKASNWGNQITVDSKSSGDNSNTMWATYEFDNDKLVGKEGRFTFATAVQFPVTRGNGFDNDTRKFEQKNVAVTFAPAGAGGTYHQLWLVGQIAAMVLCLMGGIGLLKAAGHLTAAAHPTSVSPLEDGEAGDEDDGPDVEIDE